MRLPADTIAPLLRAARDTFGADAQAWLFGSRTNDSKHGGDIDLYVKTDIEHDTVARRSMLLRQLEEIFGEQKIDLAVRPRSRPLHPLHIIAREQDIALSDAMSPLSL